MLVAGCGGWWHITYGSMVCCGWLWHVVYGSMLPSVAMLWRVVVCLESYGSML